MCIKVIRTFAHSSRVSTTESTCFRLGAGRVYACQLHRAVVSGRQGKTGNDLRTGGSSDLKGGQLSQVYLTNLHGTYSDIAQGIGSCVGFYLWLVLPQQTIACEDYGCAPGGILR